MTVTSPDINIFSFKTIYDLSGTTPVVRLTNQSSGPNLANLSYWFVLENPSGVQYHIGTEGTPDKSGVWNTEFVIPEAIPQFDGHIDWSGSDYKITGYVKDSEDNIFEETVTTRICRPPGNKAGQRNNYAAGRLNVMMNCTTAKLFVEDVSSYSYNGLSGQNTGKTIKLVFPPDDTETIPDPFESTNENTINIPIPYNGKNFQILLGAIYDFDYGNGTVVRIKYKFKACFDVNCGTELCTVLCWIEKFENELQQDGCSSEERNKLTLILSKLTRALAGIVQPLCSINVAKIISEIKELTGDCGDCESSGGGINAAGGCAVPVDLEVQ